MFDDTCALLAVLDSSSTITLTWDVSLVPGVAYTFTAHNNVALLGGNGPVVVGGAMLLFRTSFLKILLLSYLHQTPKNSRPPFLKET